MRLGQCGSNPSRTAACKCEIGASFLSFPGLWVSGASFEHRCDLPAFPEPIRMRDFDYTDIVITPTDFVYEPQGTGQREWFTPRRWLQATVPRPSPRQRKSKSLLSVTLLNRVVSIPGGHAHMSLQLARAVRGGRDIRCMPRANPHSGKSSIKIAHAHAESTLGSFVTDNQPARSVWLWFAG